MDNTLPKNRVTKLLTPTPTPYPCACHVCTEVILILKSHKVLKTTNSHTTGSDLHYKLK